jgi:hypothetical protein
VEKFTGKYIWATCCVCFEPVDLVNSDVVSEYPGRRVCKECMASKRKPQYTAGCEREDEE